MKLTDLNPGGGIGANSLLVETGPFRFAIDSGLHPKFAGNKALPDFSLVEHDSLDFIILTHCTSTIWGLSPSSPAKTPGPPCSLAKRVGSSPAACSTTPSP